MPWSQSNLSVFKTKTDKEHHWADWEGCDRTNIYVAGFPRQNYRSSLYQHNFTVCRVSTFFHCTCSLNVWFRLTKCRLTRFRRPHLPMISSVVCLCVFMWKDGHAWLYGGWTAARMGIGKEFTNPKFVTVYQDFGILLNWYKLPLCSCMSNRHLPLFLVRHLHALEELTIDYHAFLWLACRKSWKSYELTFFPKEGRDFSHILQTDYIVISKSCVIG